MTKVKVASVLKTTEDLRITELWLETLPIRLSYLTYHRVISKSFRSNYIVWCGGIKFEFFE